MKNKNINVTIRPWCVVSEPSEGELHPLVSICRDHETKRDLVCNNCTPENARLIVETVNTHNEIPWAESEIPKLSQREMEALKVFSNGVTEKEAGHLMGISPKTVSKYKQAIFWKWRVSTQIAMIRVALRHGILTMPEFLRDTSGENCTHEQPAHLVRKNY